jgi:hypothetical protein
MTLSDISLLVRKLLVSIVMYVVVVGFFFAVLSFVRWASGATPQKKEVIHPKIVDN